APTPGNYTTGSAATPISIAAGGVPTPTAFGDGAGNVAYVEAAAPVAFDPAVASTYTHSLPINVHDSLGNSHQLMQYFAKRPSTVDTESTWDVYYRLGGQPVNAPLDNATQLTFDQGGRLMAPTAPVSFNMAAVPGSSPAMPLA